MATSVPVPSVTRSTTTAVPPPAPEAARPPGDRTHLVAAGAMLAVAALWGATYVVVKDAVASMPVSDFLALRFALATLAVVAVRPLALLRLSRAGWGVGFVAGLALGAAYGLQTLGLLSTPASVSGFITGMLVVLTPVAAAVLLRERLSRAGWLAVLLATAGLALLSLRGLSMGAGEALTLGAALAFALHIVALSRWAPLHDVYGLVTVQLLTISLVAAAITAPDGFAAPAHGATWGAVLVTGVAATAVAYAVQTWAQSHLSATRTGVILTTEPVFAGLVGVLLAGEVFSGRAALGATMVLGAMLLAVTRGSSLPSPNRSWCGEPPPVRRSRTCSAEREG